MSDTFLDNQIVTAQDLNNIAIDLGAADYSHFPETPPQSAVAALNEITKDLAGAGILGCKNKCAPSIESNTVTVDTGVIVFSTGAKKRIEVPVTIDVESGKKSCIYALNDTENNTIYINASDAFPEGDCVYIAEISASGVLTDKRQYSVMKVVSDAPHVVQEAEWDGSVTGTPAIGDLVYSLPLISSSFKHIYVYRKPASYETEIYQASLLDLQNNVFTQMLNSMSTSYMALGQTGGSIYTYYGRNSSSLLDYKIEDGYLNFYLSQNSGTYSPAALHIVLS